MQPNRPTTGTANTPDAKMNAAIAAARAKAAPTPVTVDDLANYDEVEVKNHGGFVKPRDILGVPFQCDSLTFDEKGGFEGASAYQMGVHFDGDERAYVITVSGKYLMPQCVRLDTAGVYPFVATFEEHPTDQGYKSYRPLVLTSPRSSRGSEDVVWEPTPHEADDNTF